MHPASCSVFRVKKEWVKRKNGGMIEKEVWTGLWEKIFSILPFLALFLHCFLLNQKLWVEFMGYRGFCSASCKWCDNNDLIISDGYDKILSVICVRPYYIKHVRLCNECLVNCKHKKRAGKNVSWACHPSGWFIDMGRRSSQNANFGAECLTLLELCHKNTKLKAFFRC